VPLVQAATGAPLTKFWHQGAKFQGNLTIKPGTAIATFDSDGRYGNKEDGSSHAAIYLRQDGKAIFVIDQWNVWENHKIVRKQAPHERPIAFINPRAKPADIGTFFYVVE
jgi:hypothetical protein